jgi:hypothetical protein
MSTEFDDAINDLWSLIQKNDDAVNYLRSASGKLLFAQARLQSMRKHIEDFKAHQEIRDTVGALNVDMDFDHCISSLRSSIEHLLQLINSVADLGLSPLREKGENIVSIKNVAEKLSESDNSELKEVAPVLDETINESWYKDLHGLRIILFHESIKRLSRSVEIDMTHASADIDFRLPPGTAPNTTGNNARLVDMYCEARINDVEKLLFTCFNQLIGYVKAMKVV